VSSTLKLYRMLFFFQAEDGIRDKLVTGVQTCALPICERERERRHQMDLRGVDHAGSRCGHVEKRERPPDVAGLAAEQVQLLLGRSEERRVGKECRDWWATEE